MTSIGIIGYGYWGPNLVRNFAETPGTTVAAVSDLDPAKLAIVQRRHPAVKTTTNFQDLLADASIDAMKVGGRRKTSSRGRRGALSVARSATT